MTTDILRGTERAPLTWRELGRKAGLVAQDLSTVPAVIKNREALGHLDSAASTFRQSAELSSWYRFRREGLPGLLDTETDTAEFNRQSGTRSLTSGLMAAGADRQLVRTVQRIEPWQGGWDAAHIARALEQGRVKGMRGGKLDTGPLVAQLQKIDRRNVLWNRVGLVGAPLMLGGYLWARVQLARWRQGRQDQLPPPTPFGQSSLPG